MSLAERFCADLDSLGVPPGALVVVAVSGGPDSSALLDLLVATRAWHRWDLLVAHVDHGIHLESGAVARQVRELAASYGLPIEIGLLRLGPDVTEGAARERRYAWLEQVRTAAGAVAICTAHHADDQAETVLMRVFGGSAPAGLAAMAPRQGSLIRPLLRFRREELVRYATERELPVWSDPANRDPRHLRSWIRTSMLPRLRERIPGVDAKLVRVADHAAADRAAWDAALDAVPGVDAQHEVGGVSVAAAALTGYDSALAGALLRAAARRAGCRLTPTRAAQVLAMTRAGRSGAALCLADGWRAELSFGRLRLVRTSEDDAQTWALSGNAGERRWGDWVVRWQRAPAPARQARDGMSAWFIPGNILVRRLHAGDIVRPLDGVGRRRLARSFQDARVPRGERATWPVFEAQGVVVWTPGVCRSNELLPREGTEALRVDASHG